MKVFEPLRKLALAGLALVMTALPIGVSAFAQTPNGPVSVADLAERLVPGVVNISTSQNVSGRRTIPFPQLPENSPFRDFFDDFFGQQQGRPGGPNGEGGDGPQRRVSSLGSGFIIDASGLVVTNNHVIADADEIEVILQDGTKLPATLIGTDDKTDIALLQVESSSPLPALTLASSDQLRVGDWVLAIGNPFGLGGTVTLGIVSAMNRDIGSGPYDAFIQTDAAINRGNSGGPLFNMQGEVVGVNTAIISPSGGSIGIGFSVPSNTVREVITQLRDFGETRRGWLGVNIQEVTDDIAASLGLDSARGALVAGVTLGGPADEAGIERGDVVIRFNGDLVATVRALPRMVASTPVGTEVEVVVMRSGEEMTLSVTLGRLEDGERLAGNVVGDDSAAEDPAMTEEASVLGMTLMPLDDELRAELSLADEVEGVVVSDIDPESVAYSRGIRPGHVILEVGEEPVASPTDVAARIETLRSAEGSDKREQALFLVQTSEGQIRFIPVPID